MSKYISKKKTCFISTDDQSHNNSELREVITSLLQRGYEHFYFNSSLLNKQFIEILLNMQKVYKTIQIFIVHNSKKPFWKKENITNLPLYINNETQENKELNQYLTKNCELIIDEIILQALVNQIVKKF